MGIDLKELLTKNTKINHNELDDIEDLSEIHFSKVKFNWATDEDGKRKMLWVVLPDDLDLLNIDEVPMYSNFGYGLRTTEIIEENGNDFWEDRNNRVPLSVSFSLCLVHSIKDEFGMGEYNIDDVQKTDLIMNITELKEGERRLLHSVIRIIKGCNYINGLNWELKLLIKWSFEIAELKDFSDLE